MGFESSLFITQPVDENLTCSLCLGVFDRPTTACSNGHAYCVDCLTSVKHRQDVCPECRESILDSAPLNRPMHNLIANMKLCCECSKPDGEKDEEDEPSSSYFRGRYAVDGETQVMCDWEGLVSEYPNHLKTCEFRIVACPLGCDEKISHRGLKRHMASECKKRLVECPDCSKMLAPGSLDDHAARLCPEVKVSCRFCNLCMKRKELGKRPAFPAFEDVEGDEHDGQYSCHFKVCPKLPLKCDFFDMGCNILVSREELAAHEVQQARYHARLVHKAAVWEKRSVIWSVSPRHFNQDRHTFVDSPTAIIFDHKFFMRLHIEGQKVQVELCTTIERQSTLAVRILDCTIRAYDEEGNQWITCHALDLENNGKIHILYSYSESGHNFGGRCPFILVRDDSNEGGSQSVEVTKDMIMGAAEPLNVEEEDGDDDDDELNDRVIDITFEVKRPKKICWSS